MNESTKNMVEDIVTEIKKQGYEPKDIHVNSGIDSANGHHHPFWEVSFLDSKNVLKAYWNPQNSSTIVVEFCGKIE